MQARRLNFLIVEPEFAASGSLSGVVNDSKIANECKWVSDLRNAESAIASCTRKLEGAEGKVVVVDGDFFGAEEILDFSKRLCGAESVVNVLACIIVKSQLGRPEALPAPGQLIHLKKPLSFVSFSAAVANLGLGWELKDISKREGIAL